MPPIIFISSSVVAIENPTKARGLFILLILSADRSNYKRIFLFLSFGFLAVLFSKKSGTEVFEDKHINVLFFSAVASLSAMLLTGAYGTGETARACLFMVPYFLMLLKNIDSGQFRCLFFLCLLQTFGMQMIGNFYW